MKKINSQSRVNVRFIPDLILEKYLLGEMSRAELRKYRTILTEDKEIQERLDALRRSNQEIMEAYPTTDVVAEVNHRLWVDLKNPGKNLKRLQAIGNRQQAKGKRQWYKPLRLLPTAGLAVILIGITLGFSFWNNIAGGTSETTRIKGIFSHPQLIIFRERGTSPQKLYSGAVVNSGERLQFGYNAAGKSNGVVLSIDGRGVVTLHFPERADGSTELQFNKAIFAYSYELDDAPHFERFFFVTANEPINVSQVLEAARKLAGNPAKALTTPLNLPVKLIQTSFLVKKGD